MLAIDITLSDYDPMGTDGIVDRETLQSWLETRGRADAISIAQRSLLRIAPFWFETNEEYLTRSPVAASVPWMRSLLHLGLAADDLDLSGMAMDVAIVLTPLVRTKAGRHYSQFVPPLLYTATAANSAIASDVASHSSKACKSAGDAADHFVHGGGTSLWAQIRADAMSIERGENILGHRLWSFSTPDWFKRADVEARALWAEDSTVWSFWTDWWDGVLSGEQINWELQRDVALILDEDWLKGPAHIAALIARLVAERESQDGPDDSIEHQITMLPAASSATIAATRVAIASHRLELPATIDAVLGYINLEIGRLQSRNHQSDDDQNEAQRQIRVLKTIYETVQRLNVVVDCAVGLTDQQVVKVEKLSRLFVRKFQEWPRANADELVDNGWRGALVCATAVLMPMVGVPASIAATAGVVLFGGKKIVDGIKGAKDLPAIGTGG